MQSAITIGPVGPFTLVLETRLDRINTFWALNYAVMVEEHHALYKRFWPISHHDRSLYFLAYDDDILIGGTRLIRPLEDGLFTQTVLAPNADMPSAASLRALGAVGELTSLVATKRVRRRERMGRPCCRLRGDAPPVHRENPRSLGRCMPGWWRVDLYFTGSPHTAQQPDRDSAVDLSRVAWRPRLYTRPRRALSLCGG